MISLETAEKALKNIYLGVVADQLNFATNPFVAKVQQTTESVFGKEIVKLASYGLNGGVGAGTETGKLPLATGNNYAQFRTDLKNLYGTIEISDKAIRSSEGGNVGAFVNLLNAEIDGLLKASKFNFARMIFGDGTGRLAAIEGVESTHPRRLRVNFSNNLFEGMCVDIANSAGTIVSSGNKITNVVRRVGMSAFVDFEGDIGLSGATATGGIYMQGSRGLELTGLGSIFHGEDEYLYGLRRSENQWLLPTISSNWNEGISATRIQATLDAIEEQRGGSPDMIISSFALRHQMVLFLQMSRINTDFLNLDGGFKALSFNGIPWVAERCARRNTIYMLSTEDFKLHQLCDWRWLEGENSKILRQIPGKAAYTATLVKYADLICDRPAAQAALINVSETALI